MAAKINADDITPIIIGGIQKIAKDNNIDLNLAENLDQKDALDLAIIATELTDLASKILDKEITIVS